MTNERMTIHKALAELKVIGSRIENAISDLDAVTAVKNGTKKICGKTVEQYKADAKATLQKVNDLINRRNAIKKAVVLSNATTTVVINGVEMTVAEAIDMKNSGMDYKKTLLAMLESEFGSAQRKLELHGGERLEQAATDYVLNVVNNQPKESRMTVNDEAIRKLREQFIENNEFVLIDSIQTEEVMTALRDEINEFMTEIDSALSVSNALTIIEIAY